MITKKMVGLFVLLFLVGGVVAEVVIGDDIGVDVADEDRELLDKYGELYIDDLHCNEVECDLVIRNTGQILLIDSYSIENLTGTERQILIENKTLEGIGRLIQVEKIRERGGEKEKVEDGGKIRLD